MPNNAHRLDGAQIDVGQLFSEQHSTENGFYSQIFSEDFFLQHDSLPAMTTADSSVAADQTATNLAICQPTVTHSPAALKYPPGGNMAASSCQGDNDCAVFNQTMQQVSHLNHPFEGDDDWDEFVDTTKRANNWDQHDPRLRIS